MRIYGREGVQMRGNTCILVMDADDRVRADCDKAVEEVVYVLCSICGSEEQKHQ